MGNQSLKTAFKGHLKNEIAEEQQFHMNAEFLFEDKLIDIIYEKVKKNKIQGEFDIDVCIKENNNQINLNCEDILIKKLMQEIHQNITAGFSSPEANLEFLKETDYEKYFTVYCPSEVTQYTTLQQKKFFILYNLYVEKFKEAKKEGAGFFDFVRRFFEERDTLTDNSEATQISLQGGIKFSIHLLKEIQNVIPNSSIVKSSLQYLYENFRNASPLSLYGVNKTFFVMDQSVNECRDFLKKIIEDQVSQDKDLKIIALKILLVLGIMRGNVEDLVMGLNLIESQKLDYIDIAEELDRISFDVEETALNPKLYQEIEKVKQDGILFYLQKNFTKDKPLRYNFGYTTDGQYLYIHYKGQGFLKIGAGENDKMLGKVYQHKNYLRQLEKCKILYFKDYILLRSKHDTSKPLFFLNNETLEEEEITLIQEKEHETLEFKNDKENNRYLNVTPLFTDSNYLYVLSYHKPDKDDDEDEENQDQAQENRQQSQQQQQQQLQQQQQQQQEDQKKKKMNDDLQKYSYEIEIYDLQFLKKNEIKIKFVKSIPMLKDKDNLLIKSKLILKRASFVTNGKLVIMIYKRNMHFFDLSTGIRLSKSKLQDELKSEQDGLVTYDIINHRLWYINRKDKELYSFICPNFKRVVKEENEFQVKYLKKRINAIRNKSLPPTKTVKEKQMDNVLAALGLQQIKSVIKEGQNNIFENANINENKFLIMSLLADSSNQLERERPQIHWNPKKYEKATERLLKQFKSPFCTNLTPYFFEQLSKLLNSFIELIDEPKNSKNLEQQYAFYFTLKVLKSNLISLTICEIDLKDVIQDDNIYNNFYQQFKSTVVKIIEKGYKKEFQTQEMTLLWKEIYDECLLSMSMGLGMITNSFQEINEILKKSLQDLSNEKNQEYALLIITNFARHETIRKLINSEQNLTELFTLFQDILKIQTDQVLDLLKDISFEVDIAERYKEIKKTDLQDAVTKFIYRFCEKFLVFYTEFKDNQLSQKTYMINFMIKILDIITQNCNSIMQEVYTLYKNFYDYIEKKACQSTSRYEEIQIKQYTQKIIQEVTNILSLLSMYVCSFSTMEVDFGVMSPVSNSIISFIDTITYYFLEINHMKQTNKKLLKPKFTVESNHPYMYFVVDPMEIHCKGAESFQVQYKYKSQFPPLDFLRLIKVINPYNKEALLQINSDTKSHEKQNLISQDKIEFNFEYADIKKQKLEHLIGNIVDDCYGFGFEVEPAFSKPLVSFNGYLDEILRQCCWLIGRFSFSLIKIKKPEKETDEEKNYKMLLHSKIFSGGFENKYLHLFSKRTAKRLVELTEISQDQEILTYLQHKHDNQKVMTMNEEEKVLYAIIHINKNDKVEKMIVLLQRLFSKTVIWSSVGGITAEKMVRAAFAPIMKYSNLIDDFCMLLEELSMEEDMMDMENIEDQKERDSRILNIMKQNKNFEQIQKRWAVASRMRTFYQEIKKSISEAIEKRRQRLKLMGQFQEQDDVEQIDPEPSLMKMTSSVQDSEKLDKDIELITHKIQEKSEFLLRLSIPEEWEQQENDDVVLMRTTSEIADQKHNIMEQENQQESEVKNKEWKKKLHQWRMMQQSKGVIKSMESMGQKKMFDSVSGSVMACLQSAISLKRIQKQVEQVYLNATQRVAGLKLIGTLMNKPIPHVFDLINWFCSSLRANSNQLCHYLDDIRGCGKVLENQARKNFFYIIQGLLKKLIQSTDNQEIRQILNSLRWNYSAYDHKILNELRIFKVLRDGNTKSTKLMNLWGSKFKYQFLFKEESKSKEVKSREQERKDELDLLNKVELSKDVLDLYEFLLVTFMGRSLKSQQEGTQKIKLKETNRQQLMPSLERIQSIVDVDATLSLLSQAYEIIFKELERFVEFVTFFEGINWKSFVRIMNRFRKTGQYFVDEEGRQKRNNRTDQQQDDLFRPDMEINEYNNYYDEEYYQEEYEGGQLDYDQNLEQNEKEKEQMELFKFEEFYNIRFTQRLLQMINLLASVSINNAYASHVLFNISHPQQVSTLIGLLFNAPPSHKILVIKILEHTIQVLPPELFEESVNIMTREKYQESSQSNILHKVRTQSPIGVTSNKFTRIIFNYLLVIRNKIWARKFESQGMYGVSNALVLLLRKMFENPVWRHLHEKEIKQSLQEVQSYSFQEQDALLCIIGGELQGLSTGMLAQDRNDNKVTLLGFADQWIDDQEEAAKKNLKVPKPTMNFEQKTNKAIGLFINENNIDNNEVLILDPQELVLIGQENIKQSQLPIKDLLVEKDLMYKLIKEGILNQSHQKIEDLTIEQLNYKIYITKIVYSLINERQEQFIDFLKQEQMQNIFLDLLNLLFEESCKILKTPITLQLDWVEQKCFEIRKEACESKITLFKHKELSCQVVIDKIFFSYNINKKEKYYTDYDLVEALNFDNIIDIQLRVGFFDQKDKSKEFMIIEGPQLYTEKGIQVLSECELVLTCDLNLEEYQVFLEKQEQKIKGISEKPIIMVDREDFKEINSKYNNSDFFIVLEKNQVAQEEDFIKFQADQLAIWTAFDIQAISKALKQVENDFSLASKLNGLVKDEQKKIDEEKKRKAAMEEEQKKGNKKLEEILKEEEEKKKEKVRKEEEEKELEIQFQQKKEEKSKKKQQQSKEVREEKEREQMQTMILELVQEDIGTTMKFELKERKKLEQQTAEALYKSIKGFNEQTAYQEYSQNLQLLFTLYCRRILQKILTLKFEESIQIMLNSDQRKKQFKQFLKIISNEAIFVRFNTRNKKLLKNINLLLQRIVIKCQSDENYKPFIDELFRVDVLEASKQLIKHLKNEKVRSVKVQFSSEQKATQFSNPYFVLAISKIFLEQSFDDLIKDDNKLPVMIEQYLSIAYLFNKDPELKVKIFEFILNILEEVQRNYQKLSINLKTRLQQMWLFKAIFEKYSYNANSNEQVYQRHHLLLLEILMKLLHLKKLSKKEIHSIYTKNEVILQIQRAKDVCKETNQYKLLQYLIHYNKLSSEQKTIKKSYESAHKIFDCKVTAQFRIDEIEKMTCLFDENCEIEPDTAIAITRDYFGKEILQVLFASELPRYSFDVYDENLFMHYPCKPSTIFAFGDCYHGKLGIEVASGQFERPTIIKKCLNKVKDIQSYNNALVIQSEDNLLYRAGYKEYWLSTDKQYMRKWDKRVKTYALGYRHCLIVDENGMLKGEGVSNSGGMGTDVYENKTWSTIKFPPKERVKQISCAYDYSMIVTESGNLYATGNNILIKLNMINQNKFERVDLGQAVKAKKVRAGYSVMALLLVEINNQTELWSAGYNGKGALGSGENITSKSIFARVAYDTQQINFVDMDIYSDHAAALTSDGQLYQWGGNTYGRCGIRDKDKNTFPPMIWEPKKVEYFNEFYIHQIACGSCHTILIASPRENMDEKRVYAYGRDDANGHHLACTQQEAAKEEEFIKHMKRFDNMNVYKVEAGVKCSFVCCEGEPNLLFERYEHSYAQCSQCQVKPIIGPLHFIQDNNQFQFWCETCSKNTQLPNLCFALKGKLPKDIQLYNFPKLDEKLMIQEGTFEFTCDFTKIRHQTDKQPLYLSYTKLTEVIDEFRLCEESYYQANNNDINPIIYYRINQNYMPINMDKYPVIKLEDFYSTKQEYGIRFTLSPDFQYTINQNILQETWDLYNKFVEEMKKCEAKIDEDLYNFIEDYLYQHRDMQIANINANAIELDDRRFTEKTKKLPDTLKKKRLHLLMEFNRYASQLIPFIDYHTKLSNTQASARLNAYFMKAKEFIMFFVKSKYQSAYVNNLQVSSDKRDVNINRMRATRFFESQKIDHTGEYTVFGQVFKTLQNKKYANLQINNSNDRAWTSKFIGEGSIDVGGPYRETIFEMCKELQSHALPLLIKTQNQKNDFGEHRDKWIPSPSSTSPSHISMFEFLGAMIGMSIRCSQILNLNFPSLFWKKLIDEPLDRSDLNMIDSYCLQMLDGIKNLAQTLPEKEFQEYHDQKFITCLSDGNEIELVPGGKNKILTKENAQEYINLVMDKRLNEFEKQIRAIKKGIGLVFPLELVKLYTWKELEYKVCGKPSIDLLHLKAITKYNGCTESDETIIRFWRVLESFADEEKSLYLKFVWGRSRLPLVDEKFGDKHTIKLIEPPNCDQTLPIAHTCFFAIDIPKYSTEEIMKDKLLYAVKFCQAIDTDGSPYEILGEQDLDL